MEHDHEGPKEEPCTAKLYSEATGKTRTCGAEWYSVLHPVLQFRSHWCSALDAGGDCCHEEATN